MVAAHERGADAVSARAEILASVRQALAGSELPAAHRSRGGTGRSVRGRTCAALFAQRIADYRSEVVRCAAQDVDGVLREVLAGRRVVIPAGLPWTVDDATVDTGGLTALELDGFDGTVSAAALGIAVTGTLVLDHGIGQGRRALSLVPDLLVCVLRADQVVATVPDAIAQLDPARPQTWISGPSATSDIELSRVEGVHGPRTLIVILVD